VQGAVIGAFSAGLNHGIGDITGGTNTAHGATAARTASIALHGISGGIVAELQGGKFGSGFVSAGLTETFSPVAGMLSDSPFARAIVMGVIGGTISELSGDKFANGAGSAVFAQLFNHGKNSVESARANRAAEARGVTEGEVRIIQEYFGESVPYEQIRISQASSGKYVARTIGMKITYLGAEYYSDDFSTTNAHRQSIFLHEVMHIWQNVNIPSYSFIAAGLEHLNFADPYAYSLSRSKSLLSYRYEQQGQIIQDYAYARQSGDSMVGSRSIRSYERMIFRTITNIYRSP